MIEDETTRTFEYFDKFELDRFADQLFTNIQEGIEKSDEGAYTLSLQADFGCGKTTFLEMFANRFKNEADILIINAWQTDFYDQPIISILAEFIDYVKPKIGEGGAAEKLEAILGNLGNQVIRSWIGVDVKEMGEAGKDSGLGSRIIEDYRNKKEAIGDIRQIISTYQGRGEKKLIILVDELDRAKPDYAIDFLEATKHFFDIRGVAFVFAINSSQMETTVKRLFGEETDIVGYYSKFFDARHWLLDFRKGDRNPQTFIQWQLDRVNPEFSQQRIINKISHPGWWHCCADIFELSLREIEQWIPASMSVLRVSVVHINMVRDLQPVIFYVALLLKREDVFNAALNREEDAYLKIIDILKQYINKCEGGYIDEMGYELIALVCCSLLTRSKSGYCFVGSTNRLNENELKDCFAKLIGIRAAEKSIQFIHAHRWIKQTFVSHVCQIIRIYLHMPPQIT